MKRADDNKINLTYHVHKDTDITQIAKIGFALSTPERVEIIKNLLYMPKSLKQLSDELAIPSTTLARYLSDLENAHLIRVLYQPSKKGKIKFYSQNILSLTMFFRDVQQEESNIKRYTTELPVGLFSHCDIHPPCGMNGAFFPMEYLSTPSSFLQPQRMEAELLWFKYGKIDYDFPLPDLDKSINEKIVSLTFSFEACSEVENYNNNWPSDISVWLNDVRILTFTCSGDFGGTRGKNTPSYWPINCTQYGDLNKIRITPEGIFRNNLLIKNNITLNNFDLTNAHSIRFSVGVKEDAVRRGGINLFGKNFGNYDQAIKLVVKTKTFKD